MSTARRSFLLACVFLMASVRALAKGERSEVGAFTGGHTRVVWVQDAGPTACIYVEQPTVLLMGLDSDDGKGERKIVAEPNSFFKPLLTADGDRVVFTDHVTHAVCVVPFAGGVPKVVVPDAEGEDVWTDPESHIEWLYARVGINKNPVDPVAEDSWGAGQCRRYRMDNPQVSELVWDKSQIGHFQVSGDGTAAAGAGLNGQGIFTLPNGSFTPGENGCWPSMAPDDSHRFWVFNGHHNGVHFFTPVSPGALKFDRWQVSMSVGPGEMLHPRWTNNVRYMTISGPYASFDWAKGAKITNEVAAGVEIYIGRFSEDFRKIEQWVQVTHNKRGDYWPNVWIEPQPGKNPLTRRTPSESKPDRQAFDATLQFLFTDVSAPNQTTQDNGNHIRLCGLTLTGNSHYGRFGVVESAGGAAIARDSEQIIQACQAAGSLSLSCTVTSTERQIQDPAIIAALLDSTGRRDLELIQKAGRLLVSLNTGSGDPPAATVDLGKSIANKPQHLTITFAEGHLRCYLDGLRAEGGESAPGDLKGWRANTIMFGGDTDGRHGWLGSVCDIAIHSRAISVSEVAGSAAAAVERGKHHLPAARIVVDALLIAHTNGADPKAIAPYKRCLSLSTYEIKKVVAGESAARRIAVYQWSVLGGKRVPEYEDLKPGATRRLVLEAFTDHPEQESERQTNSVDGADDLPLYYDVEFPIAGG